MIQVTRYNEKEEKVWKFLLDDFYLNPKEMIESIIKDVPDWQENIEIPDGAYRRNIPFYPIEVIRELCTNALVHRTYTARGDIFINIYHDRLEIHNPGTLPYGVTPKNILSKSIRRNKNLSKVCFDLNMMEREGSGYDMIFEKLLTVGKLLPIVYEDDDRVSVTISKEFVNRSIILLMDKAKKEFPLKQKEIITLGLLMQQSYSATVLSKILNQDEEQTLRGWLGNLLEYDLVVKTGEGKGTQYEINQEFINQIKYSSKIKKKKVQDYKLEEVIYKDITSYPNSSFGEIHKRIGQGINKNTVRWILKQMIGNNKLKVTGTNRWARYSIAINLRENT